MDDAAMSAWLITVFARLETPATMQKPGAIDVPGSVMKVKADKDLDQE